MIQNNKMFGIRNYLRFLKIKITKFLYQNNENYKFLKNKQSIYKIQKF